jgi:hypothetical protein
MAFSLTVRQQGPASAAAMWRHYADFALWPRWSPQLRAVHPKGPFAPGTTGWVEGVLGVRVPFRILEVDAPSRTWAWEAGWGPLTLRIRHAVRPRQSEARLEGPLPLVLLYAPAAALALHHHARVPEAPARPRHLRPVTA